MTMVAESPTGHRLRTALHLDAGERIDVSCGPSGSNGRATTDCTPAAGGHGENQVVSVLKPARQHGYRLSAYKRRERDFYPTPSDLAPSLGLGLRRLGLELPRVALDPCGGDGALRRCLAPFGVDVRLSDLYPEKYAAADGYVASQPLDASDPERLHEALDLAGPECAAVITNTPHGTNEACAIVRNLIDLVEGQRIDFAAALFRSIWGAEPGRLTYLTRPSFYGEILCCWRARWIEGSKGSPMHAYAWYVWRKMPRSGPSVKVRIGKAELMAFPAAANLPNPTRAA
jgi:hypothetical protein